MSITFSFEGMPQITEIDKCCEFDVCPDCHGTGKVEFKHGQYELNVTNVSAYMLLTILGLPQEYAGECSVEYMLRETTDQLLLQATPSDYVLGRIKRLHELACQALKHGKDEIYWG